MQFARDVLLRNPIYLDTETTGVESSSEVIEISIVESDGQVLYNSLVKPTQSIPPDSSRIHGITNAMVADQPGWESVWKDVRHALQGRAVGIYNAEFDIRLMKQSCRKSGVVWDLGNGTHTSFFCIMRLYAQYVGERGRRPGEYRWHSLDRAGRNLRIPIPNSHRATDDTLLARAVLLKIAEEAN